MKFIAVLTEKEQFWFIGKQYNTGAHVCG